jgi:predicted NBD/HSP70 family sugar kinase
MAVVGSLEGLRELNKLRVIDALRQLGTASRTELARHTGLSRTTVATVIVDLQASGLVVEQAEGGSEPAGRGRPPALLRLDPSAGAAVGVDFGHSHVHVAVADLSSRVLAERRVAVEVDDDATTALNTAAELVNDLIAASGLDRGRIVCAGMGVPGPFDRRTGEIGSTVIMPGWVGLRAGEELARRIGLPVEVDNDANLGALGELFYGAARGLTDFVYVKHSTGIGAGIVVGGRLHRGVTGFAGELGHVRVPDDVTVCRCGNRGCLQVVAGSGRLLESLRDAHGKEIDMRGLIELIGANDPGARRVVNDAGREVGRVLASVCNVLNPEAVIVGGDMSVVGEPFFAGIREAIDRNALLGTAHAVEVRGGALGERAGVLGALALVIGDTDRLRSAGLAALNQPAASAAT